ncbi:MAG: metallophosphoesterase family protein [Gammaproteobacteria bacterium]|nr:metallophosphoesterase family protein [Gammaproteobacteria bacterium]
MLGLLSDAHGNVAAFDRGLALLRSKGASDVYFLGDAVGYFPSVAVLHRLREERIPCLMGNHEAMLLSGDIPPERDAVYRLRDTFNLLTDDWLAWIASWPRLRRIEVGTQRLLLVHGSPVDPTFDYVYPDTDLARFADAAAEAVFMGNTHRPFLRSFGGTLFVNIGSSGLPRDHGAWGSVCLYDAAAGRARILRYSILDTTSELVARFGDLHPTVLNTLARRSSEAPYGEICD